MSPERFEPTISVLVRANTVYSLDRSACDRLINKSYALIPLCMKLKLKLIYYRQSVLVSGAHLGPATNFSFSLKIPLDTYSCVNL
jgi:hypothetical protein